MQPRLSEVPRSRHCCGRPGCSCGQSSRTGHNDNRGQSPVVTELQPRQIQSNRPTATATSIATNPQLLSYSEPQPHSHGHTQIHRPQLHSYQATKSQLHLFRLYFLGAASGRYFIIFNTGIEQWPSAKLGRHADNHHPCCNKAYPASVWSIGRYWTFVHSSQSWGSVQ